MRVLDRESVLDRERLFPKIEDFGPATSLTQPVYFQGLRTGEKPDAVRRQTFFLQSVSAVCYRVSSSPIWDTAAAPDESHTGAAVLLWFFWYATEFINFIRPSGSRSSTESDCSQKLRISGRRQAWRRPVNFQGLRAGEKCLTRARLFSQSTDSFLVRWCCVLSCVLLVP